MRENNRKPIAGIRKLPQFTTMNVIDGQAGLERYSSLIFYSLTIDNILNIIVFLILAGISIMMLTGDNSILKNAADAKDATGIAQIEEAIKLAVTGSLSSEPLGDITDENIRATLAENMPTGTEYTVTGDETTGWTVTVPSIDKTYTISSSGTVAEKELATLESISQTELTIDGGYYLQATVSSGSTEDLIWSSDNTNVATVTSEGIVKCGTETGTAIITCKGGNQTLQCTVTSTAKIVDAKNGNRTVNGQAGAYNNPTVPDGFMAIDTEYAKWSTTGEQTDVNKGLVIMDNKGNEFVWIPVKEVTSGTYPMAAQLSGTDSNGRQNYRGVLYDYASSDGTITKTAKSYSSSSGYREPAYLTHSSYADESSYNQDNDGNKIVTADSLQSEYNEMIEKVSNVGGFYIGRYESTSINGTTRVVAGATSMIASSYSTNGWYGLYARQKRFANDNSLASVGSSMIWGSQYDAMLNWMIERNIDVTSLTPTTPEGTTTSRNTTRKTGTSSTDKLNNIYDILGNSYEWTLEAYSTGCRVYRGDYYDVSYGFSSSPSDRNTRYSCFPYSTYTHVYSSRPTLYVK